MGELNLGEFPEHNGCWFLYVLGLENGLYYIGITLYPQERITAHFFGNGSNFTKRNKVIEVIELYCLESDNRKLCYKQETMKTREYRAIYGKDKVVGGKLLHLGK